MTPEQVPFTAWDWANKLDVLTMFVFLAWALHKRHLCLGYQLTERDKRISDLEATNKELLNHVFRSVGVFSKAIGREISVPERERQE